MLNFKNMLNALKSESNVTLTENGAMTHRSTQSDCLDLFGTIGALRSASDQEIIGRFYRAFAEDADLAMKTLFFARDIRGGLGERRVFRTILTDLAKNYPSSVRKNAALISEYGRFDDLLCLIDTPCEDAAVDVIVDQLVNDMAALENGEGISLLAKWLPSVNASNPETIRAAKHIAKRLGMSEKTYRQTLSKLRKAIDIVENRLREQDYTFDYQKVPSKAMLKYRAAFNRNDAERYQDYLNAVESGEAAMHTGTLMPYEIVNKVMGGSLSDKRSMDVMWKALEDFTGDENALAVIDGSGSMTCGNPRPIDVALSLGIYYAERNTGAFAKHFITFSETPRLVEIKGNTLAEKVDYCRRYDEVANTNLQAVFELILSAAIKYRVPKDEMPKRLYIISDMEFDACVVNGGMTNFQYAKKLYANNGYELPEIVFWNVQSRNEQQPVEMNEQGVALISGCTPRIFQMVNGKTLISPYQIMLDILNGDRYAQIAA